ncbi:MAG: response regulator transcription factor [Kiritimatiellae bacterium]|nr:response regulator transcription factor [Kiritimatiellia bacterium]
MPKILVIEDEKDMQFILSDNLSEEGYDVETASAGKEGLSKALSGAFDLVVLDIMLPEMSGIEVCKLLRAQDAVTPVIMLTAKGDEIDKVVGLEVGADDYITKPFGMREFLARVKAALRRAGVLHAERPSSCLIGETSVDFARQAITAGDRQTSLTSQENSLLQFLAENRGRVVSRERILKEVWGIDTATTTRTLDNYIAKLRAKLEPDPAHPRHILTAHGTGYKLV